MSRTKWGSFWIFALAMLLCVPFMVKKKWFWHEDGANEKTLNLGNDSAFSVKDFLPKDTFVVVKDLGQMPFTPMNLLLIKGTSDRVIFHAEADSSRHLVIGSRVYIAEVTYRRSWGDNFENPLIVK